MENTTFHIPIQKFEGEQIRIERKNIVLAAKQSEISADIAKDKEEVQHSDLDVKTGLQTIQVHIQDEKDSHYERISVPMAAKNIKLTGSLEHADEVIELHSASSSQISFSTPKKLEDMSVQQDEQADEVMEEDMEDDGTEDLGSGDELFSLSRIEDEASVYPNTKELQYTVSNRGSLQLILNRYVYNLFSKSKGGVVRRWRCVDYRNHKCPACTITNGSVVVKRTNLHNHPYHDKKILGKIKKKAVYSAVNMAKDDAKL